MLRLMWSGSVSPGRTVMRTAFQTSHAQIAAATTNSAHSNAVSGTCECSATGPTSIGENAASSPAVVTSRASRT